MDELIDRGVLEARETEESPSGIGDAVLAMQVPVRSMRWKRMVMPVGAGAAVLVAGAFIVMGTVSSSNAYASALQEVASNARRQQTMHEVSYVYDKSNNVGMTMEYWVGHGTVAYRQYDAKGKLFVARVNDGKTTWHYVSGDPETGREPWASFEADSTKDTTIYSAFEILNGKYAKSHKVEKTSGVRFEGGLCDVYSISGGVYRYWIDPKSHLPLKMEISSAEGGLWKKVVYDYPKSFPAGTFTPYQEPGVTYRDYTEERKKLRQQYGDPGQVQRAASGGN